MSYNDLNTIKKINGAPADLRYFERAGENDAFLKNIADNDEDLALLDRDIIPTINGQFDLGSDSKAFNDIFVENVRTAYINLLAGGPIVPALQIGLTGLASLAPNTLSFSGAPGIESIRLMTSGMLVRAANSTQLKIENTLPGSLAQWSIGSDATGLSFVNSLTSTEALKLSTASLSIPSKVVVGAGSALFPSFSFNGDQTTGIYKDSSSAKLNFAVSGVDTLSLNTNNLELLMGKLVIPTGTSTEPALTFSGFQDLGLSALDSATLGLIINGQSIHSFDQQGYSSSIEGSSYTTKKVYAEVGFPSWHTDLIARANGTKTLPLPLAANEEIYTHAVDAYTNTGWQRVSEINVKANQDYSGGSYGSSMVFSTVPNGQIETTEMLFIGSENASVHIPLSLGLGKIELNTAGLEQEIDVSNISKLTIDATLGNIEVKGFIGGKEGQMLYIYKKVPTNSFTLVFNSATASQKVLLKGSTNFVNTNDYGGITLSYDDGIWREVSRS